MIWKMKHPEATIEMLGFIPSFLSEEDPRPARAQIAEKYVSGWHPIRGFSMLPNGDLYYPSDPPTMLLAEATLRNETIRFYEHAWVAVIQEDGSFEVARLD